MRRLSSILAGLALAATASAQSLDPSMIWRMGGMIRMPMDGIVGWWGFDQINGSNVVGRVYGRNALATHTNTLFGYAYGFGPFAGAQFSQVTGARVRAASFNEAQGEALTVAAWVFRTGDNAGGDNVIASKNAQLSGTKGWILTDYYMGVYGGSGIFNGQYATQVTTGRWVHVCGVYDSASLGTTNAVRFYQNGMRAYVASFGSSLNAMGTNDLEVTIGNFSSDLFPSFPGRIANVAIHNRVLTESEIYELSQEGRP